VVEIIELQPQEAPKTLTARHAIETLGEHYTAFLAANNLSGWKPAEDYVLRDDRLADVLVEISLSTGMYLGHFKRVASRLRILTVQADSKIKQRAVLEMIAKALGYPSYLLAKRCRSPEDFIENLWPVGASISLHALEFERGAVVGDPLTSRRLLQHYRFNEQRDRLPRAAREGQKERLNAQRYAKLQPR
jgi:hypothetical protein